ncbi:MAG TPA: tyrosine-protein phosphatase [Bacteroides reticulotermitis]|nr:tyrosine-protein phosphatase [Bacteroides reticulotermitis]
MQVTSKRFFSGIVLLFGCLISLCGQEFQAKKIELPSSKLVNLYRIDDGVYRSEQPGKNDFKALEAYGITEVLNLRNRHNDTDEASGTSLVLHRQKMKAHRVNEDQLIKALRVIHQRKGPIVIHCHHGSDRTGAVCAMYRIVFQGVSKEEAIREMKDGGFGFHRIYKNIVRTIRNADVERIHRKVLQE